MRETKNEVTVRGYLYDVDLKKKTVQNKESTNFGKEFISGSISIAVDETGMKIVPIHYTYVAPTSKSGNPNRTFSTLADLMNTNDTWTKVGKNAKMIECTKVSLALNDWYDQQGNLVSNMRCEGGFVNDVRKLPVEDERTDIEADMLITKVSRVFADPDHGIEDDYLNVEGAVFGYGGVILPCKFVLRNEAGFNYMESLQLPCFTKVYGRVNNTTILKREETSTAFGDPIVKTTERNVREFLIYNISDTPYDLGGIDLTIEEVNKAKANREVYLADIKKRGEENRASKNSAQQTPMPSSQPVDNSTPFGSFDLDF